MAQSREQLRSGVAAESICFNVRNKPRTWEK